MTIRRMAWITTGVALGLGAWLFWVSEYNPCYCRFESDEMPMHVSSLPQGCRVVEIPEPWRDYEGRFIGRFPNSDAQGIIMDRIEFRADPDHVGSLMVARRGQHQSSALLTDKNSTNHYRFRLPALTKGSGGDPEKVEAISQAQWDRGQRLTATEFPTSDPQWLGSCVSGSPCADLDRAFPMTLRYGAGYAVLSPTQRWIAISSHSIEHPSGNPILRPDWYWTPWEHLDVAIYRVASGRLVRHIRGWGCLWGPLLGSSQFHGDEIFSFPLDLSASKLLVCGMGNAN